MSHTQLLVIRTREVIKGMRLKIPSTRREERLRKYNAQVFISVPILIKVPLQLLRHEQN